MECRSWNFSLWYLLFLPSSVKTWKNLIALVWKRQHFYGNVKKATGEDGPEEVKAVTATELVTGSGWAAVSQFPDFSQCLWVSVELPAVEENEDGSRKKGSEQGHLQVQSGQMDFRTSQILCWKSRSRESWAGGGGGAMWLPLPLRHSFRAWARQTGNLPRLWTSRIFPDISVICPSISFRVIAFGNYELQKVLKATQCSRPLQIQWPHLGSFLLDSTLIKDAPACCHFLWMNGMGIRDKDTKRILPTAELDCYRAGTWGTRVWMYHGRSYPSANHKQDIFKHSKSKN